MAFHMAEDENKMTDRIWGRPACPPGLSGLSTWADGPVHLGIPACPPGLPGLSTWAVRPVHLGYQACSPGLSGRFTDKMSK
jgi:hypothetical protein